MRSCSAVRTSPRWGLGLFALPALAITGLLIGSMQPVFRLKADPPAQFLTVQTSTRIDAAEFARGYWSCAKNLPFSHGTPLPTEPPAQFQIPEEQRIPPQAAVEIRRLYWHQLQKNWPNADAWEKTYKSNWISVSEDLLNQLIGSARNHA